MLNQICTALAIATALSLASGAHATPPYAAPGHTFTEAFADGFDHPGSASIAENLSFSPGYVVLGQGGRLEYDFTYDPVWAYGELRDTTLGNFWVDFVDDLESTGNLSITITAEGGPQYCACTVEVNLATAGEHLLITVTDESFGERTASVPRANGPTRFGFPRDAIVADLIVQNQLGQHFVNLDSGFVWVIQPERLAIEGSNFSVDQIVLETYTIVGNATQSWGLLKTQR